MVSAEMEGCSLLGPLVLIQRWIESGEYGLIVQCSQTCAINCGPIEQELFSVANLSRQYEVNIVVVLNLRCSSISGYLK